LNLPISDLAEAFEPFRRAASRSSEPAASNLPKLVLLILFPWGTAQLWYGGATWCLRLIVGSRGSSTLPHSRFPAPLLLARLEAPGRMAHRAAHERVSGLQRLSVEAISARIEPDCPLRYGGAWHPYSACRRLVLPVSCRVHCIQQP